MTPRIGSLFSGYQGLEAGVQQVFGGHTVFVSDIDPRAIRVLKHRAPDVPNLGDITQIDWRTTPAVDLLTGGSPCQDMSSSGLRGGLMPHTRSGLWSHMADAITVLRPPIVIWENVRGALSAPAYSDVEPCPWCLGDPGDGEPVLRALGAVLADLADRRFDAVWVGVPASDVGAPHNRFRVFLLAWDTTNPAAVELARAAVAAADATDVGHERRGPARRRRDGSEDGGDTAADTARAGREGRRSTRVRGAAHPVEGLGRGVRPGVGSRVDRGAAGLGSGSACDTTGGGAALVQAGDDRDPAVDGAELGAAARDRSRGAAPGVHELGRGPRPQWGRYEAAVRRWEAVLDRPGPAPTIPGSAGQAQIRAAAEVLGVDGYAALAAIRAGIHGAQLNPVFVEWMMGLPAGHVTDVPGLSRNDMLHLLGNGVVPQQAAHAVLFLLRTMLAAVDTRQAVAS